MLAATHLIVLASVFAGTLCADPTTSAASALVSEPTTSAGRLVSSTMTEVTSSIEKISTSTPQHKTTTAHAAASSQNMSLLTPTATSPQTRNGTEETHASSTPDTNNQTSSQTSTQTSTQTVSHRGTLTQASKSPNITAAVINTTGTDFPHEWGKGDLAGNPGLVAILLIFCITLVLVLVVAMVKCIQSPRSNFERLEDVPMDNVSEKSPFAQHSK